MVANKVCPVVLRSYGSTAYLLAFEHPLAGYLLVKGTIEAGEAVDAAALRELAEESGITSADVLRSLGTWSSGFEDQVWEFILCQPCHLLPNAWKHHALDDGGHTFRFFWHPLSADADAKLWHFVFRNALGFIRRATV